jgi:crotonobetainyl-CoA:carnitine CoA-transferase CaiB-like acyl-CoA transferase
MQARMHPVPEVGEHTRAVLEELGYSAAEIGRFEREKAI